MATSWTKWEPLTEVNNLQSTKLTINMTQTLQKEMVLLALPSTMVELAPLQVRAIKYLIWLINNKERHQIQIKTTNKWWWLINSSIQHRTLRYRVSQVLDRIMQTQIFQKQSLKRRYESREHREVWAIQCNMKQTSIAKTIACSIQVPFRMIGSNLYKIQRLGQ